MAPRSRRGRIAEAGNTGTSSGVHLHFEFSPPGNTHTNDGKIDPHPCIAGNSGSITVYDNGSLQDDSFAISINEVVVCRTSPGGRNSCALGGYRPGSRLSLSMTVTEAPDDAGTYEIVLTDGLLFDTGRDVEKETLPQNTTLYYTVLVPG